MGKGEITEGVRAEGAESGGGGGERVHRRLHQGQSSHCRRRDTSGSQCACQATGVVRFFATASRCEAWERG